MIGRSSERGSGISVLAARHDDDDDVCSFLHFLYMHFSKVFFYFYHGSIESNKFLNIYLNY